jgi:protein-tyrosine phosphatase
MPVEPGFGRTQIDPRLQHINFRLMDESAPEQNPNLDFVLMDAATLVHDLREEGKTVLLHCVAAHSRTPTVAIAYAMVRGVPLEEAMSRVCAVLPAARPNRGFRNALVRLSAGANAR